MVKVRCEEEDVSRSLGEEESEGRIAKAFPSGSKALKKSFMKKVPWTMRHMDVVATRIWTGCHLQRR